MLSIEDKVLYIKHIHTGFSQMVVLEGADYDLIENL